MTDGERPALRRRLRAAAAIDAALKSLGLPRPRARISAYRPMDGEIDPAIVLRRAGDACGSQPMAAERVA